MNGRRSWLALLAVGMVACNAILGIDDHEFVSDGGSADGSAPNDAATDAATDATIDSTIDSTIDATIDSTIDSTIDAATDATIDSTNDVENDATVDAPTDAPTDAPADQSPGMDAPMDGGDGATVGFCPPTDAATYNTMSDLSRWSTVDLTKFDASASQYQGGTFDGRYVYLVQQGGLMTRYDTTKPFTSNASWQFYAPLTGALMYSGAIFDGRYVYFVPSNGGSSLLLRFDTSGDFTNGAFWSSVDTSSVLQPDGGADASEPFSGGTFDGRFVYLAPTPPSAPFVPLQFDTQSDAGFTAAAFAQFDASGFGTNGAGALYDGRHVYFGTSLDFRFGIYDTEGGAFTNPAAWTRDFLPHPVFFGFAFDGTHAYVIPFTGPRGFGATIVQFDVRIGPTDASTFDPSTLNDGGVSGFAGGAFDGRYVYFIPGSVDSDTLVRFDSTGVFNDPGAWSTLNTTTLSDAALVSSFIGAVFDGRYLYLVPSQSGVVARFDAKTPCAMPDLPAFYGSFY